MRERDAGGVMTDLTNTVPPILRWAGSKRQILEALSSFWKPSFKRYVEPFAGSAALFFRTKPARALLSDLNYELIDTYEVIRNRPDDVHSAVCKIERSEEQYYRIRAQQPKRLGELGRAVRFVYLNRYCFNGIYRTNSDGHFNVPFAHNKPGSIPPIEDFRRCAVLLQNATLRCGDFGGVLSEVRQGDFVYLDPPYVVNSRRVFRQYGQREFSIRDVERLAAHLIRLDRVGASFVVSYADCSEARKLLSRWQMRRIKVRRNVAGFAAARRSAFELLVTNIT